LLIALGAVVMLGSVLYTRRLLERLEETAYERRWRALFVLMAFFLIGYVGALGITAAGLDGVFDAVVGLVFLFGAVFVLLVVNTGLVTVDDLQEKRESLREQVTETETARRDAVDLRERTRTFNDHLEEKTEGFHEVMQACSNGDLSRRMDPESESEAMTDVAESFNRMVSEFDKTVARLRAFATEVSRASENVTASAEEVKGASESVSRSIQELTSSRA
jgi:methyl-accepting chemotaxis protein